MVLEEPGERPLRDADLRADFRNAKRFTQMGQHQVHRTAESAVYLYQRSFRQHLLLWANVLGGAISQDLRNRFRKVPP